MFKLIIRSLQPTQPSLAYLTAATYGLSEDADQLQEQLLAAGKKLPELNPDAKLIRPPVPIMQAESNWPLLTVTKVKDVTFMGLVFLLTLSIK